MDNDHGACVNAWLERAAKGLPPEQLLHAFERAFAVLWQRSHRTLGDVTLMAIVDRVVYAASEQCPVLSTLEVDSSGLRCERLSAHAAGLPREALEEGLRFVLVQFLTVLGNLTADILTPALHAELSKVALEGAGAESHGRLRNAASNDEESEP